MTAIDPTISLGSLIAMLGISVTIIGAVGAAYLGVIRHMTTNEQQIKAMLERMEKVEQQQQAQGRILNSQTTVIAVIQEQIKFLYSWAKGESGA